MDKTPEQRFVDIAPNRVDRVVSAINSLSKCSSRNYKYDNKQVNKMFTTIKRELRIAEDKFRSNGKPSKQGFKF